MFGQGLSSASVAKFLITCDPRQPTLPICPKISSPKVPGEATVRNISKIALKNCTLVKLCYGKGGILAPQAHSSLLFSFCHLLFSHFLLGSTSSVRQMVGSQRVAFILNDFFSNPIFLDQIKEVSGAYGAIQISQNIHYTLYAQTKRQETTHTAILFTACVSRLFNFYA